MKKRILCYGDSNTHGMCADPADCAEGNGRFNEAERWPKLLQALLGDAYLVIEEGLSGRTTCFEDPIEEGMNGLPYLCPCLKTHGPIDLLIIMLGTNDTKDRYAASETCITVGMERLVKKAKTVECWGEKTPNILVIAPPPIEEGMLESGVVGIMGFHCVEKSRGLAPLYQQMCALNGCHFLDAGQLGCEINRIDFMHLTAKGHAAMAAALAEQIPQLVK